MKSAPITAAVLLTLCCPVLSAIASQLQPAVTQHTSQAITASAAPKVETRAATTATNISATSRLDASPAPAQPDLSQYTGILIDASGFANIQRSPAPNIYGPDGDLVYPDRSHVPTPDQVQDESIVRYYRSIGDAKAGVCGSNPLVITPTAVVGPAKDSVTLSAADAASFKALDAKIHFTQDWKVGFLIPANQ